MPEYNNYNKRTNPMAVGLLGAAAGAAIGIALASVLSDPQKRKRVEKQFQDFQKWGNKTLRELKDKTAEVEEKAQAEADVVADKAERIQKELDEAASQGQQRLK